MAKLYAAPFDVGLECDTVNMNVAVSPASTTLVESITSAIVSSGSITVSVCDVGVMVIPLYTTVHVVCSDVPRVTFDRTTYANCTFKWSPEFKISSKMFSITSNVAVYVLPLIPKANSGDDIVAFFTSWPPIAEILIGAPPTRTYKFPLPSFGAVNDTDNVVVPSGIKMSVSYTTCSPIDTSGKLDSVKLVENTVNPYVTFDIVAMSLAEIENICACDCAKSLDV